MAKTNIEAQVVALRVANELALKLKLEFKLAQDLRKFLKKQIVQFQESYANVGLIYGASQYNDELKNILYKHYKIIGSNFSKRIRQQSTKELMGVVEVKGYDQNINHKIDAYAIFRSNMQAKLINQNTVDELHKAVTLVRHKATLDNQLLSDKQIADIASSKLKAQIPSRAKTIAITETQNMAEKSKFIEAVEINTMLGFKSFTIETKEQGVSKEWITVLDERTRPAHAAADSQVVDSEEPFIVDGEKLMFPGDDSLGASIGNVINCRCSVSYNVNLSNSADIDNGNSASTAINDFINVSKEEDSLSRIPNVNIPEAPLLKPTYSEGQEVGAIRGYVAINNQPSLTGDITNKETNIVKTNFPKNTPEGKMPIFYSDTEEGKKLVGYMNLDKALDDRVGTFLQGEVFKTSEVYKLVENNKIKGLSLDYNVIKAKNLSNGTRVLQEIELNGVNITKTETTKGARLLPLEVNKDPFGMEPYRLLDPDKYYEEVTYQGRQAVHIRGYANIYNEITTHGSYITRSVIEDSVNDLKSRKVTNIPMYFSHKQNIDNLIGTYPVEKMVFTDRGLFVDGYIFLDTKPGKGAFQAWVQKGDLPEMSVGVDLSKNGKLAEESLHFTTLTESDGKTLFLLDKYDLSEISLVQRGSSVGSVLVPIDK